MFLPELHSPASACLATKPRGLARVLVIAFQSGKHANGGMESLTQLVEHYRNSDLELITQLESAKVERWRACGHRVLIKSLPYTPGSKSGSGAGGILKTVTTHLAWNLAVAWHVFRNQRQVVHVNDPHALWHSAFGLWLLGIPVLYNIRDTKPSIGRGERLKWRLAFALSASQVVLSSEMAMRWSGALFARRPRTLQHVYSIVGSIRPTPPTIAEKNAARQRLGISSSRKLVGYIASFSGKKAQLRFLTEAGPRLKMRSESIEVIFVGDFEPETDPYAADCRRMQHELGLEGLVKFAGFQRQMSDWYLALDLVLVATVNEGLARCMIEAIAAGTPVISFDVCSAREILEGGNCGRVVRQGDYHGLVAETVEALEDQERLQLWSENGIALATSRFTPEQNAAAYETLYERLGESR